MSEYVTEVLMGQLPLYFRPVIEFQEILKAHGYALGQLEAEILHMQNNFYIATCDSETVSYYEKLLGLNGNKGLSLEERRSLVLMKYSMRPLYTLPALKEMLAATAGENNYSVECLYERYRLIIKIIDQELQKVKGIYDMAALISPAHMELLFYAEYVGKSKLSLEGRNRIRFITGFYPRFNLPALKLDRTWKLKGGRKLSGYDSQTTIDLLPVSAKFRMNAQEAWQERSRLRLSYKAGDKDGVKILPGVLVKTSAERRGASKEQLAVRTSAVGAAGAGDIRVYNKNRLDGRFQLNGERKLNGGTELR